jgi:hypothetical protein
MDDVLKQIKSGSHKLNKVEINKNNKGKKIDLMSEMEKVLRRRFSLIDGQ